MTTHRVLLVCSQHLFGTGMEGILRAAEEVELIGPWDVDAQICSRITEASPDVVLIVDADSQSQVSANLTTAIMEAYPELPIIRAGLTENIVRVYFTHILPARGTDLLETIRTLPVASEAGNPSDERSESK